MGDVVGPPYGWETLPAETKATLRLFVGHVAEVLGDELVGLYLHGSLGRGCYHPAFSDADLLIVSHGECRDDSVAALAVWRGPGVPVHAAGVSGHQVCCNEVPTPAEFELQTESGGEHALIGRRVKRGRGDLLLVRQDAYDCNFTLAGAPVREVIPPVPWESLAVSCQQLLPYLVPHFKNPVLMLCRICYAYAHRSLCSKASAGAWAQETLGAEWREMIEAARAKYRDGLPDNMGETAELRGFEAYCKQWIAERNG